MKLLGEWNWWAPAPLKRLHDRIGFSEPPAAEPVTVFETQPADRSDQLTPV
jgi:RND superfamily putative drug exporter